MDWILYLLKASGILLSAYFGVYGLLYDFRHKVTGQVTREGRRALIGILLGAAISLLSVGLEERAAARQFAEQLAKANQTLDGIARLQKSSGETLDQALQISENTKAAIESLDIVTRNSETTIRDLGQALGGIERTTDGIGRVLGAIVPVEASITYRVSRSDTLRERLFGLGSNPEDAFRGFAVGACRFYSDDVTGFLELYVDLRETRQSDVACFTNFLTDGLGLALPHTTVNFFHDSNEDGVDGRFRIHGLNAITHSNTAQFALRYFVQEDVWELEMDDIPIRFRTQSLLSQVDYLGLNMIVVDSSTEVLGRNDGEVEFVWLDVDADDGRGFAMDLAGRAQSGWENSVFVEYRFPDNAADLDLVFAEGR
ncbi:MAG: hypothetical protein AAFY97_04565 [Pseudomonadota bacterium]